MGTRITGVIVRFLRCYHRFPLGHEGFGRNTNFTVVFPQTVDRSSDAGVLQMSHGYWQLIQLPDTMHNLCIAATFLLLLLLLLLQLLLVHTRICVNMTESPSSVLNNRYAM
uniref:Uncharacterized protein n=1 Tax=Anopheles melas TaxID=34690 RepID=A0A182TEZ5_9DIPT